MSLIPNTPLAELTELDADALGDDTGRAHATRYEFGDDDAPPAGKTWWWVTYNEGLAWHREVRVVDLPEELTTRQLAAAVDIVAEEMGVDVNRDADTLEDNALDIRLPIAARQGATYLALRADMAQDTYDPDGRAVEFAVKIELPADATDADLHEAAWPFIATCINVTDPGTFGSLYVMAHLGDAEPCSKCCGAPLIEGGACRACGEPA